MLLKDYHMNICAVFIDPGRRRFSSQFIAPSLAVFLRAISAVPLVYHAVVALVRDGGAYPGYRNAHRSAGPQSAPKPADSWQKIESKKKKRNPQLFFSFPSPLHLANPTQSQPSTLQVIAPALWFLFLPYDHTSHFPFHLCLSLS